MKHDWNKIDRYVPIFEGMYSQNFHKLSLLKAVGIWSLK